MASSNCVSSSGEEALTSPPGPVPAHSMSAHTTLPWAFPLTPLRTDSVFTISRPRPVSPNGSSMTRGPSGAPPS